jgi:hypothetical protein
MADSDLRAAMGAVPTTAPDIAPPLLPPKPPVEGECCGRGCEYCVWVYYDQALRRYEAALAQWRERYGGPA